MRTANSTRSVFNDPLIWAAWVAAAAASTKTAARTDAVAHGQPSQASSMGLAYEDAGDGSDLAGGFARAEAKLTINAMEEKAGLGIGFAILPSVGAYTGQGTSREHRVQLRGALTASVRVPKKVTVNGDAVQAIRSGSPGPGWYVSTASVDGRDGLTEPAGVLVVATGRRGVRDTVSINVVLHGDAARQAT